MKKIIAAVALCLISGGVFAADVTPNFKAARVQILEGKVDATIGCDVLPTGAEVAQMALDNLAGQRKLIGEARQVALLAPKAMSDAAALKMSFDINVIYVIYNSTDGPRASQIEVGEKIWSGASQVFPGEVEPETWTADVGCGDDVVSAVQDIIKQSVVAVAARMK